MEKEWKTDLEMQRDVAQLLPSSCSRNSGAEVVVETAASWVAVAAGNKPPMWGLPSNIVRLGNGKYVDTARPESRLGKGTEDRLGKGTE